MELALLLIISTLALCSTAAVFPDEEIAQAPDYSRECAPDIVRLIPCMPAVKGTGSPPSDACCSGIAGLLQNDPICLCYVAADAVQRNDPNINVTVALELPALCKLNADVHMCDSFPGFPGNALAPTPTTPPDDSLPPPIPGGDAPGAPAPSSTFTASPNLYQLAAFVIAPLLTFLI